MKLSKKKLISCCTPIALAGITLFSGMVSFEYETEKTAQNVFVAGNYRYEEGLNAGVTALLDGESNLKATLELGVRDMVSATAPEETETAVEMAEVVEAAAVSGAAAEAVAAPEADEWANRVMPRVQEYVNIRSEADAESAAVGKLYKGGMAELLEQGTEWSKITSGSVTGYVKNEYLAFGAEAKALAEQDCRTVAVIQTESLRIRKEAGESAGVITLAGQGEKYTVLEDGTEWVKIEYKEGKSGYVAKAYVSVELELGKAVSAEEEAEALRKAEAEKAKKEAEKQAAVAKAKAVETVQGAAMEASVDETILLAAVVQMEAGGQGYEGKLAVASVVMNRVNSSRYPNTITGVIYQKGQFPGAHNGILDRILSKGPRQDCIQAAADALAGKNNAAGYMGFCSLNSSKYLKYDNYSIIGSHYFY